ncbi:hypothetical protein SERLA73DRAFT_183022 [Serpula lacrymans var. lacrymans S7.3]|uniref:Uncharacterized protein n=1 Tax=Serpula lacrymans var. lacrymans (strain S7.3) TaxID=936435 RepID=F8Q1G1_SERL3|nr:hypothetical protein SERLA73DRAFT_183022 [Serpula lacrymans var. lacrymans S7.3]
MIQLDCRFVVLLAFCLAAVAAPGADIARMLARDDIEIRAVKGTGKSTEPSSANNYGIPTLMPRRASSTAAIITSTPSLRVASPCSMLRQWQQHL